VHWSADLLCKVDCSRRNSGSSGNSILGLPLTDGPFYGASNSSFFRNHNHTLASSSQGRRQPFNHIVEGASDTSLPLVVMPVPLATLSLLTGFLIGTLYLCASWRTLRVNVSIIDDHA
jgi:hypothetical protein